MSKAKTPGKDAKKRSLTPQAGPARAQFQELGALLKSRLSAVLGQVGGTGIRPVALAKALRLDDSLAARVLRSVRASDPLSSLRELPAPQGLRLFLDAAAKHGADAVVRQAAAEAVARFDALLGELPLGRSSLNTAIDGWLPSGRARAEGAAKQAVFKATSQTMGFTVDTVCFATAIQPSAAGDMCDAFTFVAMDGIRRLREGSPILLFGHSWRQDEPPPLPGRSALPAPVNETLDGEREFTDARKLLLADVGDSATLPLRMIDRPNHTRIVLDSGAPALNVPVTAAVGYMSRNLYRRYRVDDRRTDVFMNACKVPIRVFVQDLFIHEDVFPSFVPNIVARMDNLTPDPATRDEELLEVDRLDLDVDLVRLGWGLDRVGVKEWAGYEPAVASVFERVGWDPSRFRVFRCYMRYPFPFVSLTTWFDLPGQP